MYEEKCGGCGKRMKRSDIRKMPDSDIYVDYDCKNCGAQVVAFYHKGDWGHNYYGARIKTVKNPKTIGKFGRSTPSIEKLVEITNHQISKLTRAGMRDVTTTKQGYFVKWFNSSRSWRARTGYQSVIKPGMHKLDANEIIVEAPKDAVNAVVQYLDELPLYANSFEARFKSKFRGNFGKGHSTPHYNVDRHGANTESFYNRNGTCVLTKTKCDYTGRGGKGYCDGCCRAG